MYIKRKLEKVIKANLFQGKVIVVYGARQVGKTTLVRKIAEETADTYGYLNCDELDVLGRLQNAGTSEALRQVIGDQKLVVIDEAQRVKNIGLKLKLMVENFPGTQIIATGSSSFALANEVSEPLTGRSFEFWLFPLRLDELFDSDNFIEAQRRLGALLVYGSYPDVYMLGSDELKAQRIKYLAANYLYKDILKFNNIKNSETMLKLLQALALQVGSEVSYNELANMVGVNKKTISDYIELLEKAFIIFRLTPYSGNLRKAIGKLRKIYFLDLGIRNAVINNLNPLQIRDDVGKLWENFVISEKYKQEVDLVEDRGGKLRGWEIKWSGRDKKPPRAWSSYKNASWKIINRDNYLGELAGKKIQLEGE